MTNDWRPLRETLRLSPHFGGGEGEGDSQPLPPHFIGMRGAPGSKVVPHRGTAQSNCNWRGALGSQVAKTA